MEYPIYYNIEEARLLLPTVEEKLRKLIRIQKVLELLGTINIENDGPNQEVELLLTNLNMKYYKKLYLYHKYLAELLTMGVIVKDLRQGLVDFYSKYQGRDIHLCWKMGEKDISHWHEIEEGFAGRQSTDILEKNTA